ncbi:TPA: slipin family protein [Candidatus Woesearchaeota archaeon]|nr:slipin family protein [Candidatus Woesearchaeota archaeon]HIH32519.1 slipin family protein [Candidatus Woesearchaeota archaeon]HIH55105.1 slipin family protein [Candidatus Woesearchaeota archaeon]HIJ01702.1 slipin family protein [Candidatus Woesearchaeota archaeon]HIJ13258.1 slipin family protein [Candidatus Woesearchaeota archaeon]
MWEIILLIIVVLYLLMGIRVIDQYEKAITFTLGKYTGTKEPGLRFVFIIIQRLERVDMRVRALDIEKQQVMTKDNVPVDVNGVIFFKVNKAEDAIIKVQHFEYAIAKHAQTALRDVCGSMTLDTVLTERQKIGDEIREIVDKETDQWGLDVSVIKLQDIEVPDDLKRIMSRQAAAEREKRANIIKSEGDRDAAKNLAAAADTMSKSKGAMQLRTLQTLDGLGPTASNTVVMALPVEVMEFFQNVAKKK